MRNIKLNKFAKARRAAKLTQKKLSEMTGISNRTIEAYEEGIRGLETAQFRTTILLCHALGCKVEDVIEDEELAEKLREMYK